MSEQEKTPRNEFIKALAKAQLNFKPVEKTASNPYFKSKYATYADVWEAVGKPLNEAGIAVFHKTEYLDGQFILRTTLAHTDGHSECSIHPINFDKNGTIQSLGSGESYAKRYNLIALTAVSIVDELEDDGENDRRNKEAETKRKEVKALIEKLPETEAPRFWGWVQAKKIEDISPEKLDSAIRALTAIVNKGTSNAN